MNKMTLIDFIQRLPNPEPWSEGEKIPWNEPGFSQRMLKEHLSQEHDLASRRLFIIEQQVEWIDHELLNSHPTKILDLGCGPGLYSIRFAQRGHSCLGIDFSPASIEYAWQLNQNIVNKCSFVQEDIRLADFGNENGLVILIFGEFNTFQPMDARLILQKAWLALNEKGLLLLEVHPLEVIKNIGQTPSSWYSSTSGLFSDRPHLCLTENFWDEDQKTATERYAIMDALSGEIVQYASSMQAYSNVEYQYLLEICEFSEIIFYNSLGNSKSDPSLFFITAQKNER